MRRASRLLLVVLAAAVATAALLPADRLHSAPSEPALRVDGASAACTDAQARVLDGVRPYCSVARAAALVAPGDTVRIAPARYAGTVRPVRGGTADAPIRFVADGAGVVLDAAGAANAIRLIGTGDVRFEGLEVTRGLNQGVWVEASDR